MHVHTPQLSPAPRRTAPQQAQAAARPATVARMLEAKATPGPAQRGALSAPCACGGTCPRCAQAGRRWAASALRSPGSATAAAPGLAVSLPGDAHEREADRLADRALQDPKAALLPDRVDATAVPAAARPLALPSATLAAAPAHVRQAVGSAGRALDGPTRRDMEGRFGADFSQVRLHIGHTASASAAALGARAYTLGPHIVAGAAGLGTRVLAHELAHVVQQTGCARGPGAAARALRIAPMIQRDLAIEPPHPAADGRVLSAEEIAAAIAFNEGVLNGVPNSAEVIEMLRDVIGATPTPAVIDQTFVEFVVDWQAAFGLPQDGKLGPRTARPLFLELGAEGAGRGQVKRGPRYTTASPINVAAAVAGRHAFFEFMADFDSDPANGIFPSCCELRQDLQWDAAFRAASIAAGNGNVPHGGFPAAHPAGRFIEDRDASNHRYGHRSGPFSDPQNFDQYLDNRGRRNQAFGDRYRGNDRPGGPGWLAGRWTFRLRVVDVCQGGRTLATSARMLIHWL